MREEKKRVREEEKTQKTKTVREEKKRQSEEEKTQKKKKTRGRPKMTRGAAMAAAAAIQTQEDSENDDDEDDYEDGDGGGDYEHDGESSASSSQIDLRDFESKESEDKEVDSEDKDKEDEDDDDDEHDGVEGDCFLKVAEVVPDPKIGDLEIGHLIAFGYRDKLEGEGEHSARKLGFGKIKSKNMGKRMVKVQYIVPKDESMLGGEYALKYCESEKRREKNGKPKLIQWLDDIDMNVVICRFVLNWCDEMGDAVYDEIHSLLLKMTDDE